MKPFLIIFFSTLSLQLSAQNGFSLTNKLGTEVTGEINAQLRDVATDSSLTASSKYTYEGRYSTRSEITITEPYAAGAHRAEIRFAKETTPEHWYAFATYAATGEYFTDNEQEIWFQAHNSNDAGETTGECIALRQNNGKNAFSIAYDTVAFSDPNNPTVVDTSFQFGAVDFDKWVTWVIHVKFSYKSDGFVQVWKNDSLKIDYHGPVGNNDKQLPYAKYGLYKHRWNDPVVHQTSHKVLYYDEFARADAGGSYDLVVPFKRHLHGTQAPGDTRKIIIPDASGGKYINGSSFSYAPGDTLLLKDIYNGKWGTVTLENIHGQNFKPVWILNEDSVNVPTLKLTSCSNVFIISDSSYYGVFGNNILVDGRSSLIQVDKVKETKVQFAQDVSCDTSLNYPNWQPTSCGVLNSKADTIISGMHPINGKNIVCGGVTKTYIPQRYETTIAGNISNYIRTVGVSNISGNIVSGDIIADTSSSDVLIQRNRANNIYSYGTGSLQMYNDTATSIIVDNPTPNPLDSLQFTIDNNIASVQLFKNGTGIYRTSGNEACYNLSVTSASGINYSVCDVTPPTFVSFTPSNGSSNIETNTIVKALFNENVLAPDNTKFFISPSVSDAVVSLDPTNSKQWILSGSFGNSITYTVTAKNISDVSGNVNSSIYTTSFTTKASAPPPDVTPPTVSLTSPVSSSVKVSQDADVTVTMSEKINASSVNTSNVQLLDAHLINIATSATLDADQQTILINHNTLAPFSNYTIKLIAGGVKDLSNNTLATNNSFTFRSKDVAPQAVIQPSATSVILPQGGGSVSVDLDGSQSNGISYQWNKVLGGPAMTLTNKTSTVCTATFTTQGSYNFRLIMTNQDGDQDSSIQSITVYPAPVLLPVIRIADSIQTIQAPQDTVILDGSLSYDPNGYDLNFYWSCTDSTITIDNVNSSLTTARGLQANKTYTFTLVATDTQSLSNQGTKTVFVKPQTGSCTCE